MSDAGFEFPSDHVLRRPFRHRRPLRSDVQRAHAHASAQLAGIDSELEALLERRNACLRELDPLRRALNRRWTHHHVRRHARVDEAPVPPAPPGALPVEGIDLRSICLTILRRHGPQDLRALHGLMHCYGYVVGSVRPVQRLGDAMAYEARCGRAVRVSRGVYAASSDEDPPRPGWYGPSPRPASPLPWNRPITDPGPPHVDPPVVHDPEHWSGGRWPDGGEALVDPPECHADDRPDPARPAGPPAPDAPRRTLPPTALGDDSSANRPRASGAGFRALEPAGGAPRDVRDAGDVGDASGQEVRRVARASSMRRWARRRARRRLRPRPPRSTRGGDDRAR